MFRKGDIVRHKEDPTELFVVVKLYAKVIGSYNVLGKPKYKKDTTKMVIMSKKGDYPGKIIVTKSDYESYLIKKKITKWKI